MFNHFMYCCSVHSLPFKGIEAWLHAAVRQCDSQEAAVGQQQFSLETPTHLLIAGDAGLSEILLQQRASILLF